MQSVTKDKNIAGNATITPDWRMDVKKSQEEAILIIASGIHPISDELLIKNAIEIANVIKIMFLSNLLLSLL